MGSINYRDVDWNNLGTEKEQQALEQAEGWGLVITVAAVMVLSLSFESVRNVFLTSDQLMAKYARSYMWLNRCDESCEALVNANLIDLQTGCEGLTRWYYQEGQRDLYAWQLAIDDRATYLGCSGFPKAIEVIAEDTRVREAQMQQNVADAQDERQGEQARQEVQKSQRFAESLNVGGLNAYVVDLRETGGGTMSVLMDDSWHRLSQRQRQQYAQSFWQKWVSINSPDKPETSRIRLINKKGEEVGGSPAGAATPIWVD